MLYSAPNMYLIFPKGTMPFPSQTFPDYSAFPVRFPIFHFSSDSFWGFMCFRS